MKCPKCNTENKDSFQFCVECGTRLSSIVTCPKCGSEIPADSMFCTNCGLKLQSTQHKITIKRTINTAKIKTTLNNAVIAIKKILIWALCIVAGIAIVLFAVNLFMTESIENNNGVISFDKYFEKDVDGEPQVTHLVFSMDCPNDNVELQKALIKNVFQKEADNSPQMSVIEYIEDYFLMDSFIEYNGKEVTGLNKLYKLNFKKNEFLNNVGLDLEMSIKQSFLQENGLACFLIEFKEKDDSDFDCRTFFYDIQSNQTLSQENVLDRNIANVIFNIIYDINSSDEPKNLSISDGKIFINSDGLEAIKPLSGSSQNISYSFKEYPILTKIINEPYKDLFPSNVCDENISNFLKTFYVNFVLDFDIQEIDTTLSNYKKDSLLIKDFLSDYLIKKLSKEYFDDYGMDCYYQDGDEIYNPEELEQILNSRAESDPNPPCATWCFRTGFQDGYGTSYLKSIEYIGNDWYLVEYFDMGWHSAAPIKVKNINGKPIIEDFKGDNYGFYRGLYDKYYGDSVRL